MSEEKVVLFMYLLLRDHLPVGEVTKLIMSMDEEYSDNNVLYTNGNLEALARELVSRLN